MKMAGIIAYIGIGSNMDQPLDQCRKAIAMLNDWPGIQVVFSSSFYRTEPVGFREQEDFVNAVCEIRTRLDRRNLFKALKSIEERMGRRTDVRWGARIIDLDLLFYGQDVLDEGDLIIPHPECHKRRFVLLPMEEIASFFIHPAYGISIRGLLDRLSDESRVEPIGEPESRS
jgi:2-amino-4-hydroxy-6-hydroxymethyldihydropteridine diphosphokinase